MSSHMTPCRTHDTAGASQTHLHLHGHQQLRLQHLLYSVHAPRDHGSSGGCKGCRFAAGTNVHSMLLNSCSASTRHAGATPTASGSHLLNSCSASKRHANLTNLQTSCQVTPWCRCIVGTFPCDGTRTRGEAEGTRTGRNRKGKLCRPC